MIYYLSERNSDGTNAGNKARNDVEKILSNKKYTPISAPTLWKEKRHGNRLLFFLKSELYLRRLSLPRDNYLIVQYPMLVEFKGKEKKLDYSYLFSKLARRYRLIAIVHDINNLRSNIKTKSTDDLKKAAYIVSHNQMMTNYLIQNGIKKEKIVNLKIFDYLITKENIDNHYNDKASICFAGNLEKSKFVYHFPAEVKHLGINLYGNGYNGEIKGINYKGTYGSEKISSVIRGKYGLIWDGNTYQTCSGVVGQYLKYNNPHKLSMYIVANMPIIIWEKAAEASFVKKNRIGFTISSLDEIPDKLQKISVEEYNQMVDAVKSIKSKLTQGYYLSESLNDINKKIANNKDLKND